MRRADLFLLGALLLRLARENQLRALEQPKNPEGALS